MIKELLEYQEIDKRLREVELSVNQSVERKKTAQAKKYLEGVEGNVVMLDAKAEELANKYAYLEKCYKKLKDNQDEYESIIENCTDTTELTYIKKKALELTSEINSVSANIESLSNDISSIIKEYNTIKKKNKEYQDQYKQYAPKYVELRDSKKAEIANIKLELASKEKSLDKDLFDKYKKKREDKIFPVLYKEDNKHCGACGKDISMNAMGKLKSEKIIECENCRRLIYVEQ